MSETKIDKPWYRDRWPWLLMLPPGASVIAGIVLLYFAVHEPPSLVVDDYARIEEISHEQAIADQRASERGLAATLTLRADDEGATRIAVELAASAGVLPPKVALRLRHAGNAAADRALVLDYDGHVYVGRTDLAAGRYDFELAPADRTWRLAGAVGRAPTTVRVAAAAE